jgi:hypothetical protein
MTRWVARIILGLLVVTGGTFWGWRHWVDNVGSVLAIPGNGSVDGPVFRSDQMTDRALSTFIEKHQIRTVLNLRGPNPGDDWYDSERATTLAHGATQVDMALSSCEWMSREQALSLADVIMNAERPLLIHCFHGSERTGLASAMTRLLTEGQTLEDARSSFSWKYLFFGLGDGVVSLYQFQAYEQWLTANSQPHSPETFLNWLQTDFTPGNPSREVWPYDPYPLVIRSLPAVSSGDTTVAKQDSQETSIRK